MHLPSISKVFNIRSFPIHDLVGHVPVSPGGLTAACHLGHSLHRRLSVPLGALGDGLGHLLDLPDPACCGGHPNLVFLQLPLLTRSLNRLTLTLSDSLYLDSVWRPVSLSRLGASPRPEHSL